MAAYKKMTLIERKLLKLKDSEEYKNQKYAEQLFKISDWPKIDVPKKEAYTFKHSGNAGDIIYSLPTIRALGEGSETTLFLNINQPGHYGKRHHPLGNVMLNDKMFDMLSPLLLGQPYINSLKKFEPNFVVDYDLDQIRSLPIKLAYGHIARWYFYLYGINADLGKPWLTVTPNGGVSDYIVVARSHRYRQPQIDHSFLKKYPKVMFVGVEEEYKDMKEMVPSIEFVKVKDFLELAQLIAGCKFFIGNQSFPFSLAEALKVNRVLEVYHLCPNVVVEGSKGYDFFFQSQFEKIVETLYEEV